MKYYRFLINNLILLILFSVSLKTYTQEDPTEWKYFTIYVNESDDQLFKDLSKEIGFGVIGKDELDIAYDLGANGDYILGGMYQLVVNISDSNSLYNYIVAGRYYDADVEKDPRALRFEWNHLSKKTQDGLLKWDKENKVKEENKKPLRTYSEDFKYPNKWKYFLILARVQDDPIFISAQDDMGINPKLESYTLVVNISDPNPKNYYVAIPNDDPSSFRLEWSRLSSNVQDGLKNWVGANKENLDKGYIYKDKIELYSEIIKNNPDYRKLYYMYFLLGNANLSQGNYDAAIQNFNESISMKPDFAKNYLQRGFAYERLENNDMAMKDYNMALSLDPDNLKAKDYKEKLNK